MVKNNAESIGSGIILVRVHLSGFKILFIKRKNQGIKNPFLYVFSQKPRFLKSLKFYGLTNFDHILIFILLFEFIFIYINIKMQVLIIINILNYI